MDVKYSPLVLRFVPPVQTPSVEPQDRPFCVLEITAPNSAIPAVIQTMADVQRFVVPQSGWLRLALIPSEDYIPFGRYTVRYFRFNNRLPFAVQQWTVPRYYATHEITVERSAADWDLLPDWVYEITAVTPDGTWELVDNRLYWVSGAPAVGTRYRVCYIRGLTLDQLLR